MKKITSFLLVAVLALSMASCTKWQAQHQIRALESLTERVEKKGDSFTKQDWTEVSQEYDEICSKMNQYEYTDRCKRLVVSKDVTMLHMPNKC